MPDYMYARVLSGVENCALCRVASTQLYHSNALMPIHPGCDCGVELVPGSERAAWKAAKRAELEDLQNQIDEVGLNSSSDQRELSRLIVTEQHGEYGPTLAWRQHEFTGKTGVRTPGRIPVEGVPAPSRTSMPYELNPDLDARNPRGSFDDRVAIGMKDGGFSTEGELFEHVAGMMREAARDSVKIEVAPQYLGGILADGKFKSMFEIRPNDAHISTRRLLEEDVHGIPKDAPADSRPIYGYLKADEDNAGYGPIKFVLKDSVKERTTMTGGDSIGAWVPGVRVSEAGSASAKRLSQSAHVVRADWENWGYVEAQIHGGVSLARDIRAIQMPKSLWEGKGYGGLSQADRDRITEAGWEVILT